MAGCGRDEQVPPPSILDPAITERDLRRVLGVPDHAERVLILGQSSHLDIDWRVTFDEYYEELVEDVFLDASGLLDSDPHSFYAVAEMGYLAEHVARHGSSPWRQHAGTGRMRVVGGGLTTPDTLLPTTQPLIRDYLLGSIFAEEHLGARPRAAWLPDSFGHSPTVPDLLSAAGYSAVGFGRADGARHSYEVLIDGLEPIVPGATTTASMLRDLGSADFVWRGPGGGEILAHYLPVREYCQGDTIDLDGYAIGGQRLGIDHDDDPEFVRARIGEYIAELTPYQRTPYLFVPVGCDFQRPRPRLTEYARWWNDTHFDETGVWVVTATFDDYMKLVSFHRDALPVLERDITPVWTGFFASRPRVKRAARAAAETLAGVEPFLAIAVPGSDVLGQAWESVALANHHDWITGTAADRVVEDEQLPHLEQALGIGEDAWRQVLDELARRIDTRVEAPGEVVVVFNPGPVDRGGVVEVESALRGSVRASAEGAALPAQITAGGRVAFLADDVPAFGWRTFSLAAGAEPGATATIGSDAATISTGELDARLTRDAAGWSLSSLSVAGEELLAGASLEWVVYADTGGLYRIGSERPDCAAETFAELETVRLGTLELVEAGPARVIMRATATVDDRAAIVELVAAAGAESLTVRVTGSAGRDRTITLRARPEATDDRLTMGVAGGVATRSLSHHYTPSLWPAVTWASRGRLAVHLTQSTGVHGSATGALEWVVFRNATSERPCDDVGPSGTEDGTSTVEVSLGRRDDAGAGATELAASMAMTRPLRAVANDRHPGDLRAQDRLVVIEAASAIATALKPASRGTGLILHLERLGAASSAVTLRPGVLRWNTVTRPDLLERDDVPAGEPADAGVTVVLDAALTALRLTDRPDP